VNEFWWGVIITLIVGVPGAYGMALLANMHTPRLTQFLESRKLIKKHKTRQQALVVFHRIKASAKVRGTNRRSTWFLWERR
jgi:hypothetical protein